MELETKKFVVEIEPRFYRRIFFEVEAKDQDEAIQLVTDEFVFGEKLNLKQVIEDCTEWLPICRSLQTHRSLINARHQKKNKKESINFKVNTRSNASLGNGNVPKISEISGVVEIGERETVEQFSSDNLPDDGVIKKMGEGQLSNGFVDDDCREQKKEVIKDE